MYRVEKSRENWKKKSKQRKVVRMGERENYRSKSDAACGWKGTKIHNVLTKSRIHSFIHSLGVYFEANFICSSRPCSLCARSSLYSMSSRPPVFLLSFHLTTSYSLCVCPCLCLCMCMCKSACTFVPPMLWSRVKQYFAARKCTIKKVQVRDMYANWIKLKDDN